MNKIIFTEEYCQPGNLHPFTLTRQVQDIRVGILTIREKWEMMLKLPSWDKQEGDYKDLARSVNIEEAAADSTCLLIHSNVLPTTELVAAIRKLKDGECISTPGGSNIAFRITKKEIAGRHKIKVGRAVSFDGEIKTIRFPWDLFHLNDWAIRQDFALLTRRRKSQKLSKTNRVENAEQLFVEKGASIEHCIINASTGPVYIGKDAVVMEGSILRGPLAIGHDACVKMGTKIYGATTIGPHCVAGGEIKNSVLFGFSNKAHDGYLGDSVIGEWCNLGAGTSNSNLKNNASDVRIWTPKGQMDAGQKCGVLMGDYSRTAINTSINTGTVIGVSSNVFGTGLTPKYIPNFSWGSEGLHRYDFEKALLDIEDWMQMKNATITDEQRVILKYVYEKARG